MRNRKYYSKLFISYLIFLLLPIIIFGSLSYFYIAQDALQNDVLYSKQLLQYAMNTANVFLDEMDKYIIQFAMDKDINEDFNYEYLRSDYNKSRVLNKLVNWSNVNENIVSVSLSSLEEDEIFSSDYGYTSLNEYYNSEWIKKLHDYGAFVTDWYRQTAYRPSWEEEDDKNLDMLSKGVRLRNRKGYFSIHINISFIGNMLQDFFISPSSVLVITDDGTIVLQTGSHYFNVSDAEKLLSLIQNDLKISNSGNKIWKVGDIEYNATYIQSPKTQWIYISTIPLKALYVRADKIRHITVMACLICILIGLIVSFIMSMKVYDPIRNLFEKVTSSLNMETANFPRDEIGYINSVMENLQIENNSISHKLTERNPIVEEKVLYDLLKGENKEFTNAHLEVSEKLFSGTHYIVYTIKFHDLKQNNILEEDVLIQRFLINVRGLKSPIMVQIDGKISFILEVETDKFNIDIMRDKLEQSLHTFNEEYFSSCTIGVGPVVKGYDKLYISYQKSVKVFEYSLIKGRNSVIVYDEVSKVSLEGRRLLALNRIDEGELLNMLYQGDITQIAGSFIEDIDTFVKDEFISKQYILDLYRQYVFFFIHYIFDNNITSDMDINIAKLMNCDTIYVMYRNIRNITLTVLNNMPKEDTCQIIYNVGEYIRENFMEDISLEMMAEKVYLSSSHLSRLFKQCYGINFNKFLIKTRMKEAERLLSTENYQIKDIAKMVGYKNLNSFTKAFKKYKGVSPYEYRKQFSLLNLKSKDAN